MADGTKGPVPVLGVKADDFNKPPSRLELRDMRTNHKDQWNLYLQAMERFMDPTKEKEPLSYFQIAGIHGRPYHKWPNYSWKKETPVVENTGYCTHTSVLFLTWHRPYLALYEQALSKHVNDIAQSYGSEPSERKDAYIRAAKEFRIPYWDWALQTSEDVTIFPWEVWSSNIPSVIRPGSKGISTPMSANPLASYKFGSEGQLDKGINKFPENQTLRWPEEIKKARIEKVLTEMRNWKAGQSRGSRGKNLTERVFWILTAYTNFGAMCCDLFPGEESDWNNFGSLEDIHNAVHGYVGGTGQMGGIAASAFDPVFWLHHTNIDRLFAIWQALHNDDISNSTFVEPIEDSRPTRVIAKGRIQTADTPLAPFNASEKIDDFWTSAAVKDTKTFGHVYPETRDWVYKTPADITAQLIKLYSYGSLSTMFNKPSAKSEIVSRARVHALDAQISLPVPVLTASAPTESVQILEEVKQKAATVEIPKDRDLKDLINGNKYLEWLVDIKALKHANNGDFAVHVFLGDPLDEDPALYIFNHNHVATFTPLGQNSDTGCEKCKVDQAERVQVTGQIPLTLALAERYQAGLIEGLAPEFVEPYLAKNLHWRVVERNSQLVPRSQIPGLLVGVVTCEVTLSTEPNGLPQYAEGVVPRPAATTKKEQDWSGSQPEGRGDGTGYVGGPIPAVT